ncbi:MAG: glycosyltransferase family 4 protein [Micropepsaceae bacterium]
MKLLVAISSLSGGGAERTVATMSAQWAAAGHRVRVVTIANAAQDTYELNPAVERVALDLQRPGVNAAVTLANNVRRVLALRRQLRVFEPDVAIGMMTVTNVLLALASMGLRTRTLGCERVHPPRVPLSAGRAVVRKWVYGRLTAVAALTERSAEWLRVNTRARQIFVVPNAVALPLPQAEPVVAPQTVCSPGRKMILGVGRLDAQKGFSNLIRAFASLESAHPRWDLVILGEGALRPELEREVKELGVYGRVFLPGRVGNLADWYAAASLFALSSEFEGFPNALLEAMAHGVPAVSYDCDTGPAEIIRNDIDGFLVQPGDMAAFAKAMDRLMANPAALAAMGACARAVGQRFAMPEVLAKWEQVLKAVAPRCGSLDTSAREPNERPTNVGLDVT